MWKYQLQHKWETENILNANNLDINYNWKVIQTMKNIFMSILRLIVYVEFPFQTQLKFTEEQKVQYHGQQPQN
jgi:hypothetical protein